MQRFEFKFLKNKCSDGREGVCMFGEGPDHDTPMRAINQHIGQSILEIMGSVLMIHLFLPVEHMRIWEEKIGLRTEIWDNDFKKDEKGQWGCILLDKLTMPD